MHWHIHEKAPLSFFQEYSDLQPLLAQLLYNRGLRTRQEIDAFLKPEWNRDIHDPFLFRDMRKAVMRTFAALDAGEHIKIFADYDADGVTAGAVLYTTLEALGSRDLSLYIPDRHQEGYGVRDEVIDLCLEEGVKLLITVDVGISAFSALERAQELDIDVIVCDHHHILKVPPAYAIIHPLREGEQYPDKNLSGVGVTFKFVQGLLRNSKFVSSRNSKFRTEGSVDAFEKWLLDLVAIGTVADVVPLLGENRVLVRFGMVVLNKTKRPGLQELFRVAGLNANGKGLEKDKNSRGITPRDIGWVIAPRLNAASRMDHGSVAFQLLSAATSAEAKALAQRLARINLERQELTGRIRTEAIARMKQKESLFVSASPHWPVAVCGLVAGRIADDMHIPTFLFEQKRVPDGSLVFEGSGRGVSGLDLMELLDSVKDRLARYGGHKAACGLAISGQENFDAFQRDAASFVETRFPDGFVKMLSVECEVSQVSLHVETFSILSQMEPFGEGNLEPIFCTRDARIVSAERVGKEQQHLRVLVSLNTATIKAMVFYATEEQFSRIEPGKAVDLAFTLGMNEWNGNSEIFLKVVDIHNAET